VYNGELTILKVPGEGKQRRGRPLRLSVTKENTLKDSDVREKTPATRHTRHRIIDGFADYYRCCCQMALTLRWHNTGAKL